MAFYIRGYEAFYGEGRSSKGSTEGWNLCLAEESFELNQNDSANPLALAFSPKARGKTKHAEVGYLTKSKSRASLPQWA